MGGLNNWKSINELIKIHVWKIQTKLPCTIMDRGLSDFTNAEKESVPREGCHIIFLIFVPLKFYNNFIHFFYEKLDKLFSLNV